MINRSNQFKFFKGCIPQILVGPFLNTLFPVHLLIVKFVFIYLFSLQKIDGLDKCHFIEALYLYDNQISKIGNISHVSLLKVLWLNKNKITQIEVRLSSD